MRGPRAAAVATGMALATAGLGACSSTPASSEVTVLTVSAAASLTDAFTEVGTRFEERHPDVDVRFNFAGSSALAEQILAGAPVDVFAAASTAAMDSVAAQGLVADPVAFASNTLTIAVPPGNPGDIASLADLADPAVSVVVCAVQVPCGAATEALLAGSDVAVTPVSLEPDVRAVLTKVIADEVDAGLVYVTDVIAAGSGVDEVPIPAASNVSTWYPIAAAASAGPEASAFVDFVLSDEGQGILDAWGFGQP